MIFLQPPTVDLDALPDEPFLPEGEIENWQEAAKREAERIEQDRYDTDARRRLTAQENARREREEAEISGRLTGDAEAFRDLRLRPRLIEAHSFEQTVRTPIVQGLLFKNSLAWLAGPSGTFKSFVTADLAFRYGAEDMDYHGKRMTSGRALLIIAEGAGSYADRRAAWEKQHDRETENVMIYPDALQLGDVVKEMPALLAVLKEEAEAGEPFGLIVFDTQAMCTVGVDENTSEMNRVISVLHRIRQASGACVLVVHHFGKSDNKGMRGSSMIYAAADTVIVVEKEKEFLGVTLSTGGEHGKQKDAIAEKNLLTLDMRSHIVGEDWFGDPLTSLVPVALEGVTVADTDEEIPLELPDVTEHQMTYLKLAGFYESRGASASDMAERMERERGPVKNSRQNVRNRMIELAKLHPPLVDQPTPKGPWFITPAGVGVIARQMALGVSWTDRAGRKRQVSRQVSGGQRNLDGETCETSAKPEAKPGLTSGETSDPETET